MAVQAHSLVLDEEERVSFFEKLSSIPPFSIEELDGHFLDELSGHCSSLPGRLAQTLTGFVHRQGPDASLLIGGLPIDAELPRTPSDGRPSPSKTSRVSELVLVSIASVLGTVIGYREEKEGRVVHDVCPVRGREERQENSGSQYFELHTENSFHPFRPDHVLLLCLREDRDHTARTLVSSSSAAVPRLSDRDVRLLREPLFRHRMPTSFSSEGAPPGYSAAEPVITGPEDDPQIRVDAFNTIGIDPDAQEALSRLVTALKDGLTGGVLSAGDLLVVDNRRAVHARTGFRPRYDGLDRWLQRVFTLREFERSRSARHGGSHVLTLPADVSAG